MMEELFAYLPLAIMALFVIIGGWSLIHRMLQDFFSRNLRLRTDKQEYFRGETVRLEFSMPQKTVRGVEISMKAVEFYETSGENASLYQKIAYEDKKVFSGTAPSSLVQQFSIPKDAPVTIGPYRGMGVRNIGLKWVIEAKVDVPHGVDMHKEIQIRVI